MGVLRMSTHPADGRCIKCRRRLRKSQQRLADHPGTVVHAGAGLCYTDWRKRDDLSAARVQQLQGTLAYYLASRGRAPSV